MCGRTLVTPVARNSVCTENERNEQIRICIIFFSKKFEEISSCSWWVVVVRDNYVISTESCYERHADTYSHSAQSVHVYVRCGQLEPYFVRIQSNQAW